MKSCWNCSAAFKMALGLMNGTTDCLPKTKPGWIPSLTGKRGKGIFSTAYLTTWRTEAHPAREVPSILGWENWLRYVEAMAIHKAGDRAASAV